jgi:DNA-binding MarR family transcriptional regulator
MPGSVAHALKQQRKFDTREQEVVLGLRLVTARVVEPWERFLKSEFDLSPSQYNVLRILRGSHPQRLASSEIGTRMIARDPDVTRLVDRLSARGLVDRVRSETDRRVVEVGITGDGLAMVKTLDVHVNRMPTALLGKVSQKDLKQLAELLDHVLERLGTYP